jgi:tetratricopeptide (TPR) repeat protein
LEHYAEAAADYARAIELNPDEESFHRFLANSYFELDNQDKRIVSELLEAKRLQPDNLYTCRRLAISYVYVREYNAAIIELLYGLSISSDFTKQLEREDYKEVLVAHPEFYALAKKYGLLPQ